MGAVPVRRAGLLSAAKPNKRGASAQRAAAARRAAAEAKHAADERAGPDQAFEPRGRPSDVFGGEFPGRGDSAGVRRRDMFSLLVLHLISGSGGGASYGNQLIEQIERLTHGVISLNPNTMYPLLRELEARGLVKGEWEHPEKRSRRLYRVTKSGRAEYQRLREALEPFLDSIVESITLIKKAIYGGKGKKPAKR
jgi:PadR family transcriptional regulator PadR